MSDPYYLRRDMACPQCGVGLDWCQKDEPPEGEDGHFLLHPMIGTCERVGRAYYPPTVTLKPMGEVETATLLDSPCC